MMTVYDWLMLPASIFTAYRIYVEGEIRPIELAIVLSQAMKRKNTPYWILIKFLRFLHRKSLKSPK